jgi:hypothetical protein
LDKFITSHLRRRQTVSGRLEHLHRFIDPAQITILHGQWNDAALLDSALMPFVQWMTLPPADDTIIMEAFKRFFDSKYQTERLVAQSAFTAGYIKSERDFDAHIAATQRHIYSAGRSRYSTTKHECHAFMESLKKNNRNFHKILLTHVNTARGDEGLKYYNTVDNGFYRFTRDARDLFLRTQSILGTSFRHGDTDNDADDDDERRGRTKHRSGRGNNSRRQHSNSNSRNRQDRGRSASQDRTSNDRRNSGKPSNSGTRDAFNRGRSQSPHNSDRSSRASSTNSRHSTHSTHSDNARSNNHQRDQSRQQSNNGKPQNRGNNMRHSDTERSSGNDSSSDHKKKVGFADKSSASSSSSKGKHSSTSSAKRPSDKEKAKSKDT